MAAELTLRVGEAEEAWNAIDRDFVNWLGLESVAAAGMAAGGATWLAGGALAVAGAASPSIPRWKRKDFVNAMPAAFFMDLKKRTRD